MTTFDSERTSTRGSVLGFLLGFDQERSIVLRISNLGYLTVSGRVRSHEPENPQIQLPEMCSSRVPHWVGPCQVSQLNWLVSDMYLPCTTRVLCMLGTCPCPTRTWHRHRLAGGACRCFTANTKWHWCKCKKWLELNIQPQDDLFHWLISWIHREENRYFSKEILFMKSLNWNFWLH